MKKEFLHCLRIQIVPGHYEEERIQNILNFCLRYNFRNVMLFINAEEYNVGHMTIEEAKPWVETMKRAKKVLAENGISVSLNPWTEIGHLDRKRPLKNGQNFTTMVDYDGNKSEMVVCPYCENWRKYYAEFYTYLLKEIEPDTIWVEDDFRLHNHAPLHYGGCFCDLHMKKFNGKLGKNYTREEFTDLLFRKKADRKVRKAWLDVNRECMRDFARFLGETVKKAGNAKVGLMSSVHFVHAMEGRDWHGIHKGLAQGGEMINRLHLPCYDEISPKSYYYEFNLKPYICRAFLPDKCKVYPELENGSFNTFTKDSEFLRFQLESAIPLCINGMTYDIYDFVGNGTIESFGYGQACKQISPYLDRVTGLALKYKDIEGVICPIDEKSVYNRRNVIGFDGLYPDEHSFYAYMNAIGINTKVSVKKKFLGKVIVLSNGAVFNFTKAQLTDLFKNNFVVLEGGAAINLINIGMGHLIHADGYDLLVAECAEHSYEEVDDGIAINGIRGYRASAFGKAGDYVKIHYTKEVHALSKIYDFNNVCLGKGDVYEENFFVVPYVVRNLCFEQFNDLRTTLLKTALWEKSRSLISTDYAGVYAYLFNEKDKQTLILVNSTVNSFDKISFRAKGVDFTGIRYIDRGNAKIKNVEFERRGDRITLPLPFERMTTATLLLR